eukprot:TRINITY_DN100500_c0_g1_i1.p1 TRINITY_DN100500_c0_g1~~TRINITY_DN100500_c0_g1_i1.p1  ORF type:complete len:529 (-),score=66.56 TRINITY_DN100500_c0_g1_i1:116-1645(-)
MAALAVEQRVILYGLVSERGREYNFRAASVIAFNCGTDGDRVGVELLTGTSSSASSSAGGGYPGGYPSDAAASKKQRMQLSVLPSNILRAEQPADRERALLAFAIATNPALATVCRFLDEKLPVGQGAAANEGPAHRAMFTEASSPLLFRIASFVSAPRELPHQFSGYMGQLWYEHWRYGPNGKCMPLPTNFDDGSKIPARIDCGTAEIGPGLVMFAGGCGAHPARCEPPHGFYKHVVQYDSLTEEWSRLPDMTTRRHGLQLARVGRQVYALGGQYVHRNDVDMREDSRRNPELARHIRFCEVYDIDAQTWTLQPMSAYARLEHMIFDLSRVAFFAAGAVEGRVVATVDAGDDVELIAFNPSRPADGWRKVLLPLQTSRNPEEQFTRYLGKTSCAASYNSELVIASGRPGEVVGRKAVAFSFEADASDAEHWHCGRGRCLPDLHCQRVGGALAVVEGKLYMTGGVNESTHEFYDSAERLDEDGWTLVPWFTMPRALHAQAFVALPVLTL